MATLEARSSSRASSSSALPNSWIITDSVISTITRDIGTPADCLRTSHELAAVEGEHEVGSGVRIDPSAVIVRSSLWDDVTVGPGARLSECIVADGVHVPDGSVYERSAIVELNGELIVRAL